MSACPFFSLPSSHVQRRRQNDPAPLSWFGQDFQRTAEIAHAFANTEQPKTALAPYHIRKGGGVKSNAIRFVAREIGEDPYATSIFGECADEPSGKLKFNVGKIEIGEGEQLAIDIRIPVTIPKDEVVAKLNVVAQKYGLEYREYDWIAPIYLPLNHFVIRTLMNVYRQVTGDTTSEPESTGGATYARTIDNCVAFGPILPGGPKVAHQPNEHVVLKDLYVAMEVYAYALYELTR